MCVNKQVFPLFRFSYSPLIDEDDDEDAKEPMLNEAFGKVVYIKENLQLSTETAKEIQD